MRVALAVALVSWPAVVAAQVSLVGPALSTDPPAGTAPVRWPDVAHDDGADVWLAVSGAGNVEGLWLAGDGSVLGPAFVLEETVGIYAQAPRVAFTGGGFFVAWHESLAAGGTAIRARIITRSAPLTGDFTVSPPGTNWEMGASLACSAASSECLVAWQSFADTRIAAQRVGLDGSLRGPVLAVDPRALYFRDPAVAWHAASDTFFVAYAGCVADRNCFVDVQRIRAGTGELVGGPIELDASIEAGYVPELAYGAYTEEVLAVWHRRVPGAATFEGRRILADGALGPTTHVSDVGSYDANDLAYSRGSNTFLFVTHGTTAQDVAIELSALGVPLGSPLPFGPASASGNFNPRVAGSDAAGWLAVTSTEFARLTTQRFATATRDPTGIPIGEEGGVPDAGRPIELDAGPAAGLDASAPDAGRSRALSSGCGCAARRGVASPLVVLVALLAWRAARSRRRLFVVAAAVLGLGCDTGRATPPPSAPPDPAPIAPVEEPAPMVAPEAEPERPPPTRLLRLLVLDEPPEHLDVPRIRVAREEVREDPLRVRVDVPELEDPVARAALRDLARRSVWPGGWGENGMTGACTATLVHPRLVSYACRIRLDNGHDGSRTDESRMTFAIGEHGEVRRIHIEDLFADPARFAAIADEHADAVPGDVMESPLGAGVSREGLVVPYSYLGRDGERSFVVPWSELSRVIDADGPLAPLFPGSAVEERTAAIDPADTWCAYAISERRPLADLLGFTAPERTFARVVVADDGVSGWLVLAAPDHDGCATPRDEIARAATSRGTTPVAVPRVGLARIVTVRMPSAASLRASPDDTAAVVGEVAVNADFHAIEGHVGDGLSWPRSRGHWTLGEAAGIVGWLRGEETSPASE